jgi:hypothetical protein
VLVTVTEEVYNPSGSLEVGGGGRGGTGKSVTSCLLTLFSHR